MTIEEIEDQLIFLASCLKHMKTVPKVVIPPRDTKVHVWYKYKEDMVRRFSAGYLNAEGHLMCFADGMSSWTNRCPLNTAPLVPWENWEEVDTKA